MIQGLRLPFFSEADPEIGAEGSIDPLGLAPLADRLAEEIAPGISARMSRIRYLTAMCASARVLEPFAERTAPDGTPPYLVLEWIVVEAFARKGADLPVDSRQIPGIDKARVAILRKEPMSARNYLKTPKVFGFHGVYRTLAQALGLLDSDGYLRDRGERLARTWEREQGLDGFLDRRSETAGGKLRAKLDEALERSIPSGRNEALPTSSLQADLLRIFRPDGAGSEEKKLVLGYLLDEQQPMRREVLLLLEGNSLDAAESDYVDTVIRKASPRLADRLQAIVRFEDFSERLVCCFDRFSFLSTAQGTQPVAARHMAGDEDFQGFSKEVASSARQAREALERLDSVQPLNMYTARFAKFEEQVEPGPFFESLLSHHEEVQRLKPPRGKRPWYEAARDGFVVRLPYQVFDPPELSGHFVHPFRFYAMLRFLADLH